MERSGNCDDNNDREASSVSYPAVGMLSVNASGRTGIVNSKQIPPRCQGNVLFRHQELQLSFGQRLLAVGGGGRANRGVGAVWLATRACCVQVPTEKYCQCCDSKKGLYLQPLIKYNAVKANDFFFQHIFDILNVLIAKIIPHILV